MRSDDIPTIRCGYCDRRFPIVLSRLHWTLSLCNYRWAVRR